MDATGTKLTEEEHRLLAILGRCWRCEMTIRCDDARAYADAVAEAACKGFITTETHPGSHTYGSHWRLTPRGVVHLFHSHAPEAPLHV